MKSLKLPLFLLVIMSLSSCSSFFENKKDIYGDINDDDILKSDQVVFSKRVSHIVTFPFNSSELPFNAAEVIEPHVRYLRSESQSKVALQGNASEEGTRSFNHKLAKERTESVKDLFLNLGIHEDRIIMLSVGEMNATFVPQRSVLIVY